MGYIRHDAIIVTCYKYEYTNEAAQKAEELGLQVIGPSEPAINGYSSLLICPGGSKDGWEDSDAAAIKRAAFREWLGSRRYEDGSSPFEWAQVSFGSDGRSAKVTASEWQD